MSQIRVARATVIVAASSVATNTSRAFMPGVEIVLACDGVFVVGVFFPGRGQRGGVDEVEMREIFALTEEP